MRILNKIPGRFAFTIYETQSRKVPWMANYAGPIAILTRKDYFVGILKTLVMRSAFLILCSLFLMLSSCRKKLPDVQCTNDQFFASYTSRNFDMGFTTWWFGPDLQDRNDTYQFISQHADIYSEQFDYRIPWKALINNTTLPVEFTNDIASRLSLKQPSHKLLLSISLLNIPRDNLLEDYDGTVPSYTHMNDPVIQEAFYKYAKLLVDQFHPHYLVLAMEVNELRIKVPSKWPGYQALMLSVKSRLKQEYPSLQISESVTLHNWYNPQVADQAGYIKEITEYVASLDFAAISFYPFLKGQHTKEDFQKSFDFLHAHTTKSIAFVETGHLAEELSVPGLQLYVPGNPCSQNAYLETLLLNAQGKDYEFIIWWTHRDYDELWTVFPDHTKDIGKIWKDTGVVDEDGNPRPAFETWKKVLIK